MPAAQFTDDEFGIITIKHLSQSRHIRLAISSVGAIRITAPLRTPPRILARFIEDSRPFIRQHVAKISQPPQLKDGDTIGKIHHLTIKRGEEYASNLRGVTLTVTVPFGVDVLSGDGQQYLRTAAVKSLRQQAKTYLTPRLLQLARHYGFTYSQVRFSNAGTRWGSCSSRGTISLNVWLMQLSPELIDYVLVHELCHTRYMNHSPQFWQEVAAIIPNYKTLRVQLKQHHPAV